MYVKRPIIMKYPTVATDAMKKSIDAFLDLLITSGKDSFKADEDFGFALEDFRFEIYSPETGQFHSAPQKRKKDLIGSIEDPMHEYKIRGSSINAETFAGHLQESIVQYEQRLKNVEVAMDFMAKGTVLLVSVNGIMDDGYDTPYTYYNKIKIW
ncbi:MAG: hypothetical protein J5831_06175 [Bacteroidales bacterium]|nr:hypothetical protein [Bacteroidales bacterium]